jgi:hypothetical protein
MNIQGNINQMPPSRSKEGNPNEKTATKLRDLTNKKISKWD